MSSTDLETENRRLKAEVDKLRLQAEKARLEAELRTSRLQARFSVPGEVILGGLVAIAIVSATALIATLLG